MDMSDYLDVSNYLIPCCINPYMSDFLISTYWIWQVWLFGFDMSDYLRDVRLFDSNIMYLTGLTIGDMSNFLIPTYIVHIWQVWPFDPNPENLACWTIGDMSDCCILHWCRIDSHPPHLTCEYQVVICIIQPIRLVNIKWWFTWSNQSNQGILDDLANLTFLIWILDSNLPNQTNLPNPSCLISEYWIKIHLTDHYAMEYWIPICLIQPVWLLNIGWPFT